MSSGLTKLRFFDPATQYYIAGRYACVAQLTPVGPNLLHHAIEMFMKGTLAEKGKTLPQLKKFSHNLDKIWIEFKSTFPDPRLNAFDPAIQDLQRFEAIRYPDTLLSDGAVLQIARRRGELVPPNPGDPVRKEPSYQLVLEDVDALVKLLFDISKLNPQAYFSLDNEDANHFLKFQNEHLPI